MSKQKKNTDYTSRGLRKYVTITMRPGFRGNLLAMGLVLKDQTERSTWMDREANVLQFLWIEDAMEPQINAALNWFLRRYYRNKPVLTFLDSRTIQGERVH